MKFQELNNLLFLVNNNTMYYNYHGIIKKKIKENKLVNIEFKDQYKNIKNVMLLYFNDGTVYPIREHRFLEYSILLEKFNNEIEDLTDN